MLKALEGLKQEQTPKQFLEACKLADDLASHNYRSNRKYSATLVEASLKERGILPP